MSDDDPDLLEVWLDGEVIETYSYDQVGWTGMDHIKSLIEKIDARL